MSERSHVYSSCFCRHSVERACGSLVTARPASTTEWTSNSVPYASKRKALGFSGVLARRREVLDRHRGVASPLVGAAGWHGRRFPGLLGRFEPGLDEAVAQELLRVPERQAARLRPHHDQEEALSLAPGRDGEVVAGFAREAGLEGLHAARILEERDAAAVDPAAVHEARSAQERPRGRIVLDEPADQARHVLGGATLPGIWQAVGIGEVSRREP